MWNSNIIKTIGAITDSKQVEIIKYIFNNSYTIVPNDVLVDVGCAKGRILGYWSKHFKDNKIIEIYFF